MVTGGRRGGFSLLEVLVGVLLLALVFAGLTAYNRAQRKALGRAERVSEAARLALTTLETDKSKLANADFFLATLADLKKNGKDSTRATNVPVGNRKYDVDLVRDTLPSTFALIRVRARASWDSRKHSVTIAKLVTSP